jgi:hypothetical protein
MGQPSIIFISSTPIDRTPQVNAIWIIFHHIIGAPETRMTRNDGYRLYYGFIAFAHHLITSFDTDPCTGKRLVPLMGP